MIEPRFNRNMLIVLPVLLVGGTETQTLNLVRVLVDAGYHVTVCCYYEHTQSMVAEMENAGAEVSLLHLRRSDGLLSLFGKLIKYFQTLRPALIHVQYVAPGLVPIVAARIAGIRYVIATVHQPGRPYGWQAKLLLRTASRLCDIFFCVSRSAEESWFGSSELFAPNIPRSGRKHFTLYNAFDVERIVLAAASTESHQLRSALDLDNKKVIGFVGRLRSEKGPTVLLEAMVVVTAQIPEATLLMVGDGPDRDSLKNRAEELGLTGSILWLGLKTQEEVFRLFGIMDVLAMPSLFEGFGLAAAEAMAVGIPVVASHVDGLAEVVVDQQTGLLVPAGDAGALAQALLDILRQPDKACEMGQAGRRRVNELFSLPLFGQTISAAYRLLLS